MKHPSFLDAISQPLPHRTSVHSHMQSTAHHYNSILNAKTAVNNSRPKQQISLDILNNKRSKNLKKQRTIQNRKLLRSLIDIQRNYSLYGTKYQQTTHPLNPFNTTKRKPLPIDVKLQSIHSIKTLKNPFIEKMKTLHISQQNLKLFDKINNIQSSFANKKEMKQWNSKLDYWGSLLQSSNRVKQENQSLKKNFFSTFVRMREEGNLSEYKSNGIRLESVRNTLRLEPNSLLIRNPQMQTLLGNSKRMTTQTIDQASSKQSLRIKKERKRNKKYRRVQTQDSINPQQHLLYSDHY